MYRVLQGFMVLVGFTGFYADRRCLCAAPATFVTRGRLNSWISKVGPIVTNISLNNVSYYVGIFTFSGSRLL